VDNRQLPPARLSRSQKRDLLQMTGAALVSIGFFAAPLLISQRQAESSSAPTPSPGSAARPFESPDSPSESSSPAPSDRVTIVATHVEAPVTTPGLRRWNPGPAPQSAASTPRRATDQRTKSQTRPRTQPATVLAAAHTRVARKVARLIAGDGRYTVAPFPSLPAASRPVAARLP
jgi:hypothetical protein